MKFQILCLASLFLGFNVWASNETLKIGLIQEFGAFNPINLNLASTETLQDLVIRRITNRNAKGEIIPDLAESIPTLKNKKLSIINDKGVKKLVAEWKIKESAKWGNGAPVLCEDWQTSWKIGLSDNVSTQDRSVFSKIEKIEWGKNPKICKVTYSEYSWSYDRDLPQPVPSVLEKPVFEKWSTQKEAYDQNSIYTKDPKNPGLYNGPYVVSEFKIGSHIIFKPNPYFYGHQPFIKSVLVRVIGDTGTLRAHLGAGGDINFVAGTGFPPDLAISFSEEYSSPQSKYKILFFDSPVVQAIFPNLEGEIVKEKEVREALDLSIDRVELTQSFFKGRLSPAYTFLSPKAPEFVPRKSNFNLIKAQEILKKTGWALNSKGVQTRNGKELVLKFRTSSGIKFNETLQSYLCHQFSKIGARCLIENQPPRVLLGDSVPHGDFALALFGQSFLPDASIQSLFSTKEIPSQANSFAGGNVIRFKDSKMDQLLIDFEKEWDRKRRGKILKTIESNILSEFAFLPLYHRREAVLMPQSLQDFEVNIDGMSFYHPENWKME